jgi:hypothetical protein
MRPPGGKKGPSKAETGAGDGIRTRDTELGKLVLYQLSYARPKTVPMICAGTRGGNWGIEGSRRIPGARAL